MTCARLLAGCALALAVGLVGAAGAGAETRWSAATPVASDLNAFWNPYLAFTPDGHALAMLSGCSYGQPTRLLAAAPRSSTFAEMGRTVVLLAGPAVYGRRSFAYLGVRAGTPRVGGYVRAARFGAWLGDASGAPAHFQQLARLPDIGCSVAARIAADPHGNVAAAWIEPRSGGREVVRVAQRRPGRAFGRARTIATATSYLEEAAPLQLAYSANGDLVVAFQRTTTTVSEPLNVDHSTLALFVRVKRHSRSTFSAVQRLGPTRGSSSVAIAVAATGRAAVAWGTQDGGEDTEEPWAVRAALLPAGARRFTRTQLLDPGEDSYPAHGPLGS